MSGEGNSECLCGDGETSESQTIRQLASAGKKGVAARPRTAGTLQAELGAKDHSPGAAESRLNEVVGCQVGASRVGPRLAREQRRD